jgi:hypothetical protein
MNSDDDYEGGPPLFDEGPNGDAAERKRDGVYNDEGGDLEAGQGNLSFLGRRIREELGKK